MWRESQIAQLVSSALKKNVPPATQVAYAHRSGSPRTARRGDLRATARYDRLGWAGAGDAPTFDKTGGSFQLASKMIDTPAVIPVRMLPPNALRPAARAHARQATQNGRGASISSRTSAPTQRALRGTILRRRAPDRPARARRRSRRTRPKPRNRSRTTTCGTRKTGCRAGCSCSPTLGLIQFERLAIPTDETSPLVVVPARSTRGIRTNLGPAGGARDYNLPWPDGRLPAQPYTTYRVSFALDDELAPDRPDPTVVS